MLQVNFRSLRDSGITWLALAHRGVEKIPSRAGHEDLETTLRYVKQAEDLTGLFGTPFAPLPEGLLESPRIAPGRFNAPKLAGKLAVLGAGGGNRT